MSTLAQDTFTDSNGTDLSAHTMDVGSGWTENAGDFPGALEVQSNHVEPVGESRRWNYTDVGATDYTAEIVFTFASQSNDNSYEGGLLFRYKDDDETYYASVSGAPNNGNFNLALGYYQAGFNGIGSDPVGANYSGGLTLGLKVVVSGTSVNVYLDVNGGGYSLRLSESSMANFLTATKVGIWMADINAANQHYGDDFLVTSAGGGGGGKPWYAQYGMTRQFRREQRRKEQLIERARRETILRAA